MFVFDDVFFQSTGDGIMAGPKLPHKEIEIGNREANYTGETQEGDRLASAVGQLWSRAESAATGCCFACCSIPAQQIVVNVHKIHALQRPEGLLGEMSCSHAVKIYSLPAEICDCELGGIHAIAGPR